MAANKSGLFTPDNNTGPQREALIAELERHLSPAGIRRRKLVHRWHATSWAMFIRFLGIVRRFADLVVAAILLVALSPILLSLYFLARISGGGIAGRQCLGRWATLFRQYRFQFPAGHTVSFLDRSSLAKIPALFNILRGDMSFVGPRPVAPDALLPSERTAWKRYDIRPGFICLWWLRKRANIAYSSEAELDAEYADSNSFWGDLGIAARALPALAFGEGASEAPDRVTLLDIPIANLTMTEATGSIVSLARGATASQLCFVNADCVNIAVRDGKYKSILQHAEIVLADGIGVRIAGRILNQHIRENVNGTDLLPPLCAALEQAGLSLYLLGGRPGVPEQAARWISQRYPALRIAGCRHGYFDASEEQQIVGAIHESGAEVLIVALGAPKQEKWIAEHKHQLGCKVSLGAGGLLDFYSGRVARAPVWMREMGLEWFYRFIQEPGRMWRRYFFGNALFLYRVMRRRFTAVGKTPRTRAMEGSAL